MIKEEIRKLLLEEFTDQQLQEVQQVISQYKDKPGSLIPVLEEVQSVTGYLPDPIQDWIAQDLRIPRSRVFGVVTFYSFFSRVPKGKHQIKVCLGTACYVRGSKKIVNRLGQELGIKPGGITTDKEFSLDTLRCLGACALAPVMVIEDETYRQVKVENIKNILSQYS